MNIVEINGSLGNGLKRYNVFEQVSISNQPFTQRASVLYGVTKPTDIIQTYQPTNILIDADGNPIGNSKPVYFGIRVYPFISARQQVNCENNTITYGRYYGLSQEAYFTSTSDVGNRALLPDPYTGQLYPQPQFKDLPSASQTTRISYRQAMQQFINDCVFPTKPKLNLPGQTFSSGYYEVPYYGKLPYFATNTCVLSQLNQREPTGVLCLIQDKVENLAYQKYMVKFDGQNLNFKFGLADNSDFAEVPEIYLPYLYRTYAGLINDEPQKGVAMGVIIQCLLYDNLGDVITG